MGKTTLLTQWAARSQRPFAWVSVDARDNDPIVLLTYVATALGRVSRVDPGVFEALTSPGASIEGTVVPRPENALATMDEAVVLVIDDLHLLDSPPCLDAIAGLARHVPKDSQPADTSAALHGPWGSDYRSPRKTERLPEPSLRASRRPVLVLSRHLMAPRGDGAVYSNGGASPSRILDTT